MQPAVLLHPFFAEYFRSFSVRPRKVGSDEDLCRLGACFLLAQVLVHELAHCFRMFPVYKTMPRQAFAPESYASQAEAARLMMAGRGPECVISWELSIFTECLMRFTDFHAINGHRDWITRTDDDLMIPERQEMDEADRSREASRDVTFEGTQYKTTSAYGAYERDLVPWGGLVKWFDEKHWAKNRTPAEIMSPPHRTWKLRFEIPDPQDLPSVRQKIVRLELEPPGENTQQCPASAQGPRGQKRRGEDDEMEGEGEAKRKKNHKGRGSAPGEIAGK